MSPSEHRKPTSPPVGPLIQRPIVVIAGARPNFMKVVPILHELDRRGLPHLFVHTGQHYDINMSAQLLSDLDAPPPDALLEVGSGSHAVQTARIMERFEPVLMQHRPSWVVVVGDVNRTLACALVTAKVRHTIHCRLTHGEAELRSHGWTMPEEVNRVLTDRPRDLVLTPVEEAAEGLSGAPPVFVGNVMIDALLATLPRARHLAIASRFGWDPGSYILVTLHRPSNVGEPERFALLLELLEKLSKRRPVVFPMHPRTRARVQGGPLEKHLESLIVVESLGYAEMVGLLDSAAMSLTDSGGVLQKSTILGVPCVTKREQTEWPSTVSHGTNRLATWPLTVESVVHDALAALECRRVQAGSMAPAGWDGRAASRIVDAMCEGIVSVPVGAVRIPGGGN